MCVRARDSSFFFFRLWKKKPNNPKPVFLKLRKKEKARERERKRGEVKQRRKSLKASLTKNSLPLCFVSAVVLKSNKALEKL